MNEKRCILCDRAYEYDKYKLFGRGCLSNLYELLSISNPPRGTKDKEMYLCNKIAHRNFKFFLSKKKKYVLAEKYIALKYLDKINFNKYSYDMPKESKDIDYNSFLDGIKDRISKEIEITDEKITNIVVNNEEFKTKINELIKKYGNESIELKEYHTDFIGGDLFLALHGVDINLNGNKNENGTWNLQVEIKDIYDYTDFKSLKEYVTSANSIPKSIFSTTLNNFAVASSEYGVIIPYTFIMKFEMKNYVVGKEE